VVVDNRFRIYWVDADGDSDLIPLDGIVWLGIGRYREEYKENSPTVLTRERKRLC